MQGLAQSEAIGACSDLDTAGECYQRQLCIHRKYWRAVSSCTLPNTCSKSCGLPLETFESLHVSAFLCIFGFYLAMIKTVGLRSCHLFYLAFKLCVIFTVV